MKKAAILAAAGGGGGAPSDLVVELVTFKNSGGTGTTGSITPAAGGLLVCAITGNNPNTTSWTFDGSLAGTWTKVDAYNGTSRSQAIYICSDYSGSGTVGWAPDQGSHSWEQMVVVLASSETDQLDVSGVQQFKHGDGDASGLTLAWTTPPTYGTFTYVNNQQGWDAGAGFTALLENYDFDTMAAMWSAEPVDPIHYTANQAQASISIEFKHV